MQNVSFAQDQTPPSLDEIRATAERIASGILRTPLHPLRHTQIDSRMLPGTKIYTKLELLQQTGTFKARAALNNALRMTSEERQRGIVTISGGNHAVGVAYAASRIGTTAKVIMMNTANAARISMARRYGADVIIAKDVKSGFELVETLQREEGRTYIPSFPNRHVAAGTATIALEMFEQLPTIDVIIVPVGGGGLISGISACAKMLNPACEIYGVEPIGAGVMSKSLEAGAPQTMETFNTIADSLASPKVSDYALSMVSQFVNRIVRVSDADMAAAGALLFSEIKLAVEPAGAASTAAMLGPLRDAVAGKTVVPIICGSNIDAAGYCGFLQHGERALAQGTLVA